MPKTVKLKMQLDTTIIITVSDHLQLIKFIVKTRRGILDVIYGMDVITEWIRRTAASMQWPGCSLLAHIKVVIHLSSVNVLLPGTVCRDAAYVTFNHRLFQSRMLSYGYRFTTLRR